MSWEFLEMALPVAIKMNKEYDKRLHEQFNRTVREFKLKKLKQLQKKYKCTNSNTKRSVNRRIVKVKTMK